MDISSLVAGMIANGKGEEFAQTIAGSSIKDKVFIPCSAPQTEMYYSDADLLLAGGSPGGGKTAVGCGIALNNHKRSLIVRRQFADLEAPLHTITNILNESGRGTKGLTKGSNRPKYTHDKQEIVFMGLGDDQGGKQGLPFDFIYFDEASQFLEDQVRMCMGWLRTPDENQRTRVVFGTNPPVYPYHLTGSWLARMFAPWLDRMHPNPAKYGELRWFNPSNNDECSKGDTFMIAGCKVGGQSRTYIPSSFTDNPYYNPDEYIKSLASLPDSVRERLLTGDFMSAYEDSEWQVIPTAWVEAAFDRWEKNGKPGGVPMCAMGVDVAQGGSDSTVIAARYDGWYDEIISVRGDKTPTGAEVSGLIIQYRRDNATVIVDAQGGFGGATLEHLRMNNFECVAHGGGQASLARTKDGTLGFYNKRAELYWKFREALDPSQAGGSCIMLPRDMQLLADLCAVEIDQSEMVNKKGIKLIKKTDVIAALGRSPDKGDAVVMAWGYGITQQNMRGGWAANSNRTQKITYNNESKRRLAGRR
jgi:hypothetical protein